MEVEIKAWLYDILNAINEIDGFFEEVPKEFLAYKNDTRTRRGARGAWTRRARPARAAETVTGFARWRKGARGRVDPNS